MEKSYKSKGSSALRYGIVAILLIVAFTTAAGFTTRSLASGGKFGGSFIEASQPTLKAGETLTYKIHLINNGATDALANVSDKVPVELAYQNGSASHGGVYDAGKTLLTWDNVTVPGSGEVVLSFNVKSATVVEENLDIVNLASIQVIGSDGQGEILTTGVKITLEPGVPPTPLIAAYKTASQSTLAPGETLTFTIQIMNSSVDTISVDVHDPLPAELLFVDGSQSDYGTYDPASRVLSWRAVDVPAMSEKLLTFDVKTSLQTVTEPIDVTNVATILWGTEELDPECKITIVATPERLAPSMLEVTQVAIGDQDVITDPNVIIHIAANGEPESMYIREFAPKMVFGVPTWSVVRSSGWISYEADLAWTLSNTGGVHFIGVDLADKDSNRSLLTHASFDFVSLNLPDTTTVKSGLVPYLVYYDAGVDVSVELAPVSGDANLYVWYPGNFDEPNQASENPGTANDKISFTTPAAGIYIILVNALEPVTYNLTIQPAGGPTAPVTGLPGVANASPSVVTSAFATEPIFNLIGLDPLAYANAKPNMVGGPFFYRLPIIQR